MDYAITAVGKMLKVQIVDGQGYGITSGSFYFTWLNANVRVIAPDPNDITTFIITIGNLVLPLLNATTMTISGTPVDDIDTLDGLIGDLSTALA
jgi:hypothetical protein